VGALGGPAAAALGDEVLVSFYDANKIERYSTSGQDLGAFAATGLSHPTILAVDAQGNVYAANEGNNTITWFSPNGTDLGTFAQPDEGRTAPYGMAFDASGNLYVGYLNVNPNSSVTKYSPSGTSLGTFASVGLRAPFGLAFDRSGYLYAANYDGAGLTKYSSAGALLATINTPNVRPDDILLGPNGDLFVSSSYQASAGFYNADTVEEYAPDGTRVRTVASGLSYAFSLAFDSLGDLYVSELTSDLLDVYSPAGQRLNQFSMNAGLYPEGMVVVVPEPSGLLLVIAGLTGLMLRPRR
jgi:DNA-binding beta-propeller fold protein YncE